MGIPFRCRILFFAIESYSDDPIPAGMGKKAAQTENGTISFLEFTPKDRVRYGEHNNSDGGSGLAGGKATRS